MKRHIRHNFRGAFYLATSLALVVVLSESALPATRVYDLNNRLILESWDDGREVSYAYDDMGNLISVTPRTSAAPVVFAMDPLLGTVGAPIVDFQIATNRPAEVTRYQVAGLPRGLKVNTGNTVNADGKAPGVIYGTPTAGGAFRMNIAVQGIGGRSAPTTVIANISNPFTQGDALAGRYSGQVNPGSFFGSESGGWLAVALTATGGFSGTLQLGTQRFGFRGVFDSITGNAAPIVLQRRGLPPLTLNLALQLSGAERGKISGTVSDGGAPLALEATREVWDRERTPDLYGGNPAVPYNVGIEIDPVHVGDSAYPQGWGFSTIAIDARGRARLTGQLADGTRITASAILSARGELPVFVPLYRGGGTIVGSALIDPGTQLDTVDNTIDGILRWIRPAATSPREVVYPAGFAADVFLAGAVYAAPGRGERVLRLGPDEPDPWIKLELSDGGLPAKLSTTTPISTANRVGAFSPDNNAYRLNFNPRAGLFTGSFVPAIGARPVNFSGLLIPDPDTDTEEGFGYFLNPAAAPGGSSLSGGAWLGEQP